MRLSLIGPGDIEYHYNKLLKIDNNTLNNHLDKIAQLLVNANAELEILPDRGVSTELAKLYKKKGGKKVIGAVPKSDTTFGIEHLKPYINEKVNGKPLIDEIIDTGDWFKHDLIKGLLGNHLLCLGSSPGSNGERHYAVYLYKLMQRFKEGVEISGKRIHPEIRAGKNFSIIAYSPFFLDKKLPREDEAYCEKFGINLYYAKSPKELESILKELS